MGVSREVITGTAPGTTGVAAPAASAESGALRRRFDGLRRWARTPNGAVWLDAAAVWLVTRAIFVGLTFLVPALLVRGSPAPGTGDPYGPFVAWGTADGFHFRTIAEHGYVRFELTMMWPLFPALVHLARPLFGGNTVLAGLAISNAAFFAALVGLRMLAERESGRGAARRTIIYLAIFPTAFYFFAVYSESLFLALAVWAFVALRGRRWLLAGTLGCLATLTRSAGVLLVLPFAWEVWHAYRSGHLGGLLGLWRAWPGLLIPGGVAIYCAYLWRTLGDPLAFSHAASYWGHTSHAPWMPFVWTAQVLAHAGTMHPTALVHLALNGSALVAFIALTVVCARRLPPSYWLFAAGVLLLVLMSGEADPVLAMAGDGRYVLMLFPAFMALGQVTPHGRRHDALLVTMATLLTLLCAHFLLFLSVV